MFAYKMKMVTALNSPVTHESKLLMLELKNDVEKVVKQNKNV